jgi:hypothetical protein
VSLEPNSCGILQLTSTGRKISGKNETLSLKVSCKTCYVKGTVTVQLEVNGDTSNASQAIDRVQSSLSTKFQSLKDQALDSLKSYAKSFLEDPLSLLDMPDFIPVSSTALNISMEPIPDVNLKIRFDDMELYLELDTVLSASINHTFNLFTSDYSRNRKR